ncbi:hypothetical protein FKM82_019528 [Ascaphus truei]
MRIYIYISISTGDRKRCYLFSPSCRHPEGGSKHHDVFAGWTGKNNLLTPCWYFHHYWCSSMAFYLPLTYTTYPSTEGVEPFCYLAIIEGSLFSPYRDLYCTKQRLHKINLFLNSIV